MRKTKDGTPAKPAVRDLSEDEAEELLEGEHPDVVEEEPEDDAGEEEPAEDMGPKDGIPSWATLPEGLKMPRPGVQVAFLRVPAKWTTDPGRGDRWCVCWPIGELEERLAYQRARGDAVRSVTEMAKASIRVVDGYKADWTGKPNAKGSVSEFWANIGPKGRQLVRNYYVRTHTVSEEEVLDFFSKHFAVLTVS